jgi:hypothetical protein
MEAVRRTLEQSLAEPSFWMGMILVFLFAQSRFQVTKLGGDEIDPPVAARSFTTRFRYFVASATYVGVYEFIFCALLSVGSFPFLQKMLTSLVGSLDVEGQQIGSPAWAALVTTSLLPSLPGFSGADDRLRDFLHEFASIPATARQVGNDLLQSLRKRLASNSEPGNEDDFRQLQLAREAFDYLAARARTLRRLTNTRASRGYQRFFDKYQSYWKTLEDELAQLEKTAKGQTLEPIIRDRIAAVPNKAARYIACATLLVEDSEYLARQRLMNVFGLADMNVVGWQFRLVQIFISTVCVAVGTLAGALAAAWISNAWGGDPDPLRKALTQAPRYFTWVLYSVPMFTLPLIFAAGVRMYLTDLAEFGEDTLEWEDRLAAGIVTFIGAYGLSCLPLLIAEAITAPPQAGVNLERILPWGFAPAAFAVIFMLMSAQRLAGTDSAGARALNAVIDIGAHAIPAALLSYAAAAYLDLPKTVALSAAITTGFIAALLGPIQCAISRRHVCRECLQPGRAASEPRGWTADLLTPNWAWRDSRAGEIPGVKAGGD